jgi:hypothetical protein
MNKTEMECYHGTGAQAEPSVGRKQKLLSIQMFIALGSEVKVSKL